MATSSSPPSSDLSDPPSIDSDHETDHLSTAVPSTRPSVDRTLHPRDVDAPPPPKRRRTGNQTSYDDPELAVPALPEDWDNISLSSDGFSSAPGSPSHDEYTLREEAQTQCLWRDCNFGSAVNNDELVRHVQGTHCATGGPKRTKYVCEWGECQRKTSNHPSGYALKAHMRSHTKEKPYYCALPECDKAFTRSDALAKHMRTVHEPEVPRGASALEASNSATAPSSKSKASKQPNGAGASKPPADPNPPPTVDEDGNEVQPSPALDNITYIPAHHPITGQPGFMIHYPADIHFTQWESSVPADHLMRILRRQLHWAQKEGQKLREEVEALEGRRREEWVLKEVLLEGVMEGELARGKEEGYLEGVEERVREAMERDAEPAKRLSWTPAEPSWRRQRAARSSQPRAEQGSLPDRDVQMRDETPGSELDDRTPSPPPTGKSGGFEGEKDPYDNYMDDQELRFEQLRRERERLRADPAQGTPVMQGDAEREADAAGALMGLSGS